MSFVALVLAQPAAVSWLIPRSVRASTPVCARIGSAAAEVAETGASIVLNRSLRGRIRADDIERALGRKPIAVLPDDAPLGRTADLGKLSSRGQAVKRFRRLAKRIRPLLEA